jgi:hypothetical protein
MGKFGAFGNRSGTRGSLRWPCSVERRPKVRPTGAVRRLATRRGRTVRAPVPRCFCFLSQGVRTNPRTGNVRQGRLRRGDLLDFPRMMRLTAVRRSSRWEHCVRLRGTRPHGWFRAGEAGNTGHRQQAGKDCDPEQQCSKHRDPYQLAEQRAPPTSRAHAPPGTHLRPAPGTLFDLLNHLSSPQERTRASAPWCPYSLKGTGGSPSPRMPSPTSPPAAAR